MTCPDGSKIDVNSTQHGDRKILAHHCSKFWHDNNCECLTSDTDPLVRMSAGAVADNLFLGSCCIHDNCYMMCKKSKGKCDEEFFSNLRAECNANPIGSWCKTLSTLTAKTILSTSRARKAYENSQKNCKNETEQP